MKRFLLAAVLILFVGGPPNSAAAPSDRVVAIGDIHGAFDGFVSILKQTGLIDANMRWSGGRTIVVQTGDVTDRGAKVRQVLDLMMSLERQAASAGGRFIVTMGNHEVMNFMGELRDATPAIYASFGDERSEARRDAAFAAYEKLAASRTKALANPPPVYRATREEWFRAHPIGFVEYREAMGPAGVYGKWLRARPALAKVDDTIFMHGGLHPRFAEMSVDQLNAQLEREIKEFDEIQRLLVDRGIITEAFTLQELLAATAAEVGAAAERAKKDGSQVDEATIKFARFLKSIEGWFGVASDSPLWFRGYSEWSDEEGTAQIKQQLPRYKIKRFVVAHTIPEDRRIWSRFGATVFIIDTGMLSSYFDGGRASALEILNGGVTAIYEDRRDVLVDPSTTARGGLTPAR